MPRAEAVASPQNLDELSELVPGLDEINKLYNGFKAILQEHGVKFRHADDVPGRIMLALTGLRNEELAFATQARLKKSTLPVVVWSGINEHSKEVVRVDIDMRVTGGEHVYLEISEIGGFRWRYPDRSRFGAGLNPIKPTQKDILLYNKVLTRIQSPTQK